MTIRIRAFAHSRRNLEDRIGPEVFLTAPSPCEAVEELRAHLDKLLEGEYEGNLVSAGSVTQVQSTDLKLEVKYNTPTMLMFESARLSPGTVVERNVLKDGNDTKLRISFTFSDPVRGASKQVRDEIQSLVGELLH